MKCFKYFILNVEKYSYFVIVLRNTTWKESKCRVSSGPYFPVFGLNTGKYGPEKTPCLDTFDAA